MANDPKASPKAPVLHRIENGFSTVVLCAVALLPILESIARTVFRTGIYHSTGYLKHLVLWVTFTAGMITSRESKHLALSAPVDAVREPIKSWLKAFTGFFCITVAFALSVSALSFALIGFTRDQTVGFMPIRVFALILPVGFSVMTFRFVKATGRGIGRLVPAILGLLVGFLLSWGPVFNLLRILGEALDGQSFLEALDGFEFSAGGFLVSITETLSLPLIVLLVVSAFLGTPIFIVLGGLALFLFVRSGGALEVIPNESYTMLTGAVIPAIPLFALTGFILSESKAGERLVRLFRAFFGWLPGGLAVMSILVCAFFTTFTGGSGVTILALGGLLSFVLVKSRYDERFTVGLLTGSGSIGLLFPPSLPIIMYGVVAQINIKHLFLGGLLPGFLMVVTLAVLGIRSAVAHKVERVPFQWKELLPTLRESFWEILLPVIILISYFSGFTTLVETASLAVIYILFVEVVIHRDIKLSEFPRIFEKCLPVIGGVLIILAVAKGLSYYIVDADIPTLLTDWSVANIHSKYVFLILLNLTLLVTGCLMDIYSAITVVAPLVIPLGRAYGIDPIHLGVIFLANLELGYLTPPVGINLFLASYRFGKPLSQIYRSILPFLISLFISVLLITYVPGLSTLFVKLFAR